MVRASSWLVASNWRSLTKVRTMATAVAEKLSALQTAEFFSSRKARADFKAFDKIMKRRGGKAPREDDEMPPVRR
jgi:hypothetical protein